MQEKLGLLARMMSNLCLKVPTPGKPELKDGVARMRLVRNWMHRECRFSFHVQEYEEAP